MLVVVICYAFYPHYVALTDHYALLLYSFRSCFSLFSHAVLHITITVKSIGLMAEETKRTHN